MSHPSRSTNDINKSSLNILLTIISTILLGRWPMGIFKTLSRKLHEPKAFSVYVMEDDAAAEDESYSKPVEVGEVVQGQEHTEKEEEENEDDLEISESRHGSPRDTRGLVRSTGSKKRVHFLPDRILVKIHEIPPRSHDSSAAESDDSSDDTSSDSDDSSSDTSSESEESSDRDISSCVSEIKTVSDTKWMTITTPSPVWSPNTAEHVYSVAKSDIKHVLATEKATGIHRPAPSSPTLKSTSKRARRSPPPSRYGQSKCDTKRHEKSDKISPEIAKRQDGPKKKARSPASHRKPPQKPLPASKTTITPPPKPPKNLPIARKTTMAPAKLAQRRVCSAPQNKIFARIHNGVLISTCVTALPSSSSSSSSENFTHASGVLPPFTATLMDTSVDYVTRDMQTLWRGPLHILDDHVSPSHQQAPALRLPDVKIKDRRGAPNSLPLVPRRGGDFISDSIHFSLQQTQPPQMPSQYAYHKRRYHAWQMANGNLQTALQNSPSIAQLWDNVPQTSLDTRGISQKNKPLPD